jgi:hypothetical protein
MRSLTLRHAAALALIGWYLMVPPTTAPPYLKVNPDAQISRWEHYGSYDSAKECESNILYLHEQANKFTRAQRVNPSTAKESEAAQYIFGECIATDDPRLMGK